MIECFIFLIVLYAIKAWTLTKTTQKRVHSFETMINRKILNISWVDGVDTDEKVLRRINCQLALMHIIKQRKLEFFGHIIRNPVKYCLSQISLQDKEAVGSRPGRRRVSWLAKVRKRLA